ncbi:hypothetical protein ACFSTI_05570 [Rhizorhabdus histidinilytica]
MTNVVGSVLGGGTGGSPSGSGDILAPVTGIVGSVLGGASGGSPADPGAVLAPVTGLVGSVLGGAGDRADRTGRTSRPGHQPARWPAGQGLLTASRPASHGRAGSNPYIRGVHQMLNEISSKRGGELLDERLSSPVRFPSCRLLSRGTASSTSRAKTPLAKAAVTGPAIESMSVRSSASICR